MKNRTIFLSIFFPFKSENVILMESCEWSEQIERFWKKKANTNYIHLKLYEYSEESIEKSFWILISIVIYHMKFNLGDIQSQKFIAYYSKNHIINYT